MANKNKKRRQEEKTFYKVLGIIADIIMYPVMIVSLLSAFFMLLSNRNSSLPSFMGYSVVKVMSGSMVERGFEIGDIVFVKETDVSKLEVGDVVAFYKNFDSCDMALKNQFVKKQDYDGTNLGQTITGRTDVSKLKGNQPVYFHRIKNIYVLPNDGTLFFETAGSATENTEHDTLSDGYIRSDLIVGKYVETPRVIRDVMAFCASSTGMICLVVMPLSILVLLECLSIIEQINNMILENKVFYGEEPYNSPESIKANIGRDMDLYRQVYFYAKQDEKDRENVKYFLWSNCYDDFSNKKELALKEKIDYSDSFVDDKDKYFEYWSTNLSNYQKRKFEKLLAQYRLENAVDDANAENKKMQNSINNVENHSDDKQQNLKSSSSDVGQNTDMKSDIAKQNKNLQSQNKPKQSFDTKQNSEQNANPSQTEQVKNVSTLTNLPQRPQKAKMPQRPQMPAKPVLVQNPTKTDAFKKDLSKDGAKPSEDKNGKKD